MGLFIHVGSPISNNEKYMDKYEVKFDSPSFSWVLLKGMETQKFYGLHDEAKAREDAKQANKVLKFPVK